MNSEDRNYHNDHRVRAANRQTGLEFDEKRMTLTWDRYEDEDCPESCGEGCDTCKPIVFRAVFAVCDTCSGKGTHVNPSIDCGGISGDDEFWEDDEDEDGESRYMSGAYDVQCYGCNGRRVVPVIDESQAFHDHLEAYQEFQEDLAESEAESRAERMMGA